MKTTAITKYKLHILIDKSTYIRALQVAAPVGILLVIINNYSLLISHLWDEINILGVLLTFFIPFCVSSYSSFISKKKIEPGNISNLDAILKCDNCNKSDFHIHIGQTIDECPFCNEKTSWKIRKLFSFANREKNLLKSLALFARHNPQPLLRIDARGIILSVNPATMHLFGDEDMIGESIINYFPKTNQVDLLQLIANNGIFEEVILINNEYYKFLFKGVSIMGNMHIYGNNITEIKKAEGKIIEQTNELKEANKEILAINTNLENIVHQRTEKIKNQHKQIIDYAFKNAHEVRAPLARILGLIYLWTIEKANRKNAEEFIEKISQEAYSLDKIVKELNVILHDEEILLTGSVNNVFIS